jgi:HSP20 family protein
MVTMEKMLNRWFDETNGSSDVDFPSRAWTLALDVVENEEAYLVEASVPGIKPEDLDITLEDNVLTIKGEHKMDEAINEDSYRLRERRIGQFSRSVRFPVDVNTDNIAAQYENGVLTLTVPKAEEVQPKRIEIHVK